MSSLGFAVGNCSISKPIDRPAKRNLGRIQSGLAIKLSTQNEKDSNTSNYLHVKGNPSLVRRREAIGLGLCLGPFNVLLLQPENSAAAESLSCQLTVAPSGLAFCDEVVGTGPEAIKGQLIKAHYVGKLENGKVFDSSYSRGKPLAFRIGVGEVIKGWDQGILGGDGIPPMLAGGKRTLKIPPELGYGMRGAGCRGEKC
ncbi:peptidyl-prolyl cis-trans isomerase FKBP13, chloroplastic isoform X2 [Carica papaya]|uniref:peptidyl-prolyl cis-trans isomerase FKBP13, chloroplastic isoform X2 n=1 Tax=Carica papaya TaxID=3649 RepID=UPI000B8CCD35|nr:peptidyl-prolyl cis-trans isomerase FKBP13, chloroplastic isoform X2 [Carica papaya]